MWLCSSVGVFAADSNARVAARLRDIFEKAGYQPIPMQWNWTGANKVPFFKVRHDGEELALLVDTLLITNLIRSKVADRLGLGKGDGKDALDLLLTGGKHSLGQVKFERRDWSYPVKFKRKGGSIASLTTPSPLDPIYQGLTPGTVNGKVYADMVVGSGFLRDRGVWLAFVGDVSFVPPQGTPSNVPNQLSARLSEMGYSKVASEADLSGTPCFACRTGQRDLRLALASTCGETVLQNGWESQISGSLVDSDDKLFVGLFEPNLPMRRWALKGLELGTWHQVNFSVGLSDLSRWGVEKSSNANGVAGFLGADVLDDSCALIHIASGAIYVRDPKSRL